MTEAKAAEQKEKADATTYEWKSSGPVKLSPGVTQFELRLAAQLQGLMKDAGLGGQQRGLAGKDCLQKGSLLTVHHGRHPPRLGLRDPHPLGACPEVAGVVEEGFGRPSCASRSTKPLWSRKPWTRPRSSQHTTTLRRSDSAGS